MITALVFYMFALLAIAGGAMVVSSRNPVHSVLWLIFVFFNAAGLFLLLGAEFLAMLLIVVYVGAVAVLFLFVVMMLDINYVKLRQGFAQYMPTGLAVGVGLLAELGVMLGAWIYAPESAELKAAAAPSGVSNTVALGQILYTQYFYLFQIAGVILLLAMVGAILLTHREPSANRKRQNISAQIARRKEETLEIKKVATGGGI